MMVYEGQQRISDIGKDLLHVVCNQVPQLDIAYPMWLELNASSDPLDNQSRFQADLVSMRPSLRSAIETVLPIYFATQLTANLVVAELSPGLADQLADIQRLLAEHSQQVKEVEDLLALVY